MKKNSQNLINLIFQIDNSHRIYAGIIINLEFLSSQPKSDVDMRKQNNVSPATDIWPGNFSDEEFDKLHRNSQLLKIDADEVLIEFNKGVPAVYYLKSGLVNFGCHPDHYEIIPPDSCIGLLSVLTGQPTGWNVTTLSEAEILKIDPEFFLRFWIRSASRCRLLLKTLVDRCEYVSSGISSQSGETGYMLHLAKWIDRVHDRIAESKTGHVTLSLPDLEDATGCNKTEIIKALGQMAQENEIRVK